ncbi:DMT family transporter [Entomohabitans teleogrylli]|uniref:DMT family transporter n=1 Tax=Entomohabitans teleogrylli TaxID=1384589 RepID=UPI00073D891A|nr:DMT family transporter [Entomohabitans teleogrylli]
MTLTVFAVLLFAALLHATWNAIVKASPDKLLAAIALNGFAALIAVAALPFSPQPAAASFPYLGASCLIQAIYCVLLAKTYQVSDMSQTYPIMRGTAPLIVAIVGATFLGESLTLSAAAGIAVICCSILLMAITRHTRPGKGVWMALLNAGMIAAYTLIDGTGVRLSGTALGYTLWTFLLNGLCLWLWALSFQRQRMVHYAVKYWPQGLAGGVGTLLSYGLALWAMTQAPLAVVAALRETSILFGALIAVVVLKETATRQRLFAAIGIALGAIILRLA